jgi:hypothetical protein
MFHVEQCMGERCESKGEGKATEGKARREHGLQTNGKTRFRKRIATHRPLETFRD